MLPPFPKSSYIYQTSLATLVLILEPNLWAKLDGLTFAETDSCNPTTGSVEHTGCQRKSKVHTVHSD